MQAEWQSRENLRGNSEEWAAFEGWVRCDNGSFCDRCWAPGNSEKVQMCLGVWIWESLVGKVDLKLNKKNGTYMGVNIVEKVFISWTLLNFTPIF